MHLCVCVCFGDGCEFYSSALLCFSCIWFFTELFIALCRSPVAPWMPKKAPPATQSQFLLIQLGFFIASRAPGQLFHKVFSATAKSIEWPDYSGREKGRDLLIVSYCLLNVLAKHLHPPLCPEIPIPELRHPIFQYTLKLHALYTAWLTLSYL